MDGVFIGQLYTRLYKAHGKEKAHVILFITPYDIERYSKHHINYFAHSLNMNGYHFLAVDTLGTGKSRGSFTDEYTKKEQDSIDELIQFVKGEKWCNGHISMIGFSYSGYLAWMASTRHQLTSIIPMYAGMSNLKEDVWFMNGLPLLIDLFGYAISTIPYNCIGKDAHKRVLESDILLKKRHVSRRWVNIAPADVKTNKTFLIGGWSDTYVGSCFEYYDKRPNKSVMLIGPWDHKVPHESELGPAVYIMDHVVKFLKGNLPYSCRIYMFYLSSNEGQWFESKEPISSKKHVIRIKLPEITINTNARPLFQEEFLYVKSYKTYKATDIKSTLVHLPLPNMLQNICGQMSVWLEGVPSNLLDPFMIYLFVKRADVDAYHLVSVCPYNNKQKWNTCTCAGIALAPNDALYMSFEGNTFPYLWKGLAENQRLTLDEIKIHVKFSEFPDLQRVGRRVPLSKPVQSFKGFSNRIVVGDNVEKMELTKMADGTVTLKDVVTYPQENVKCTVIISGDGQKFDSKYHIKAGAHTKTSESKWKIEI
jgi:hypothetical protein